MRVFFLVAFFFGDSHGLSFVEYLREERPSILDPSMALPGPDGDVFPSALPPTMFLNVNDWDNAERGLQRNPAQLASGGILNMTLGQAKVEEEEEEEGAEERKGADVGLKELQAMAGVNPDDAVALRQWKEFLTVQQQEAVRYVLQPRVDFEVFRTYTSPDVLYYAHDIRRLQDAQRHAPVVWHSPPLSLVHMTGRQTPTASQLLPPAGHFPYYYDLAFWLSCDVSSSGEVVAFWRQLHVASQQMYRSVVREEGLNGARSCFPTWHDFLPRDCFVVVTLRGGAISRGPRQSSSLQRRVSWKHVALESKWILQLEAPFVVKTATGGWMVLLYLTEAWGVSSSSSGKRDRED